MGPRAGQGKPPLFATQISTPGLGLETGVGGGKRCYLRPPRWASRWASRWEVWVVCANPCGTILPGLVHGTGSDDWGEPPIERSLLWSQPCDTVVVEGDAIGPTTAFRLGQQPPEVMSIHLVGEVGYHRTSASVGAEGRVGPDTLGWGTPALSPGDS